MLDKSIYIYSSALKMADYEETADWINYVGEVATIFRYIIDFESYTSSSLESTRPKYKEA